mmetsp:Transcript_89861/g.155558  ORF Transcript_89861/g.155558 Transcript_89861/m.155558 type:complete len:952 (-) Transcript_89861:90-2945(-)
MAAAVAAGLEYSSMSMPSEMKSDERSDQQQDFQQLVLSCNKEGMDFLRKGQYKQAFEQLKYAEAILVANHKEDEPTSLLAVTCNNLGCYYKKVGKLHAALSYLRKALKIEVSLQTDDVTVAGTHLNICAILSKLDKHDKAVQHALCALELISNRVANASHSVSQDEYSVLAIAYHNVAVERDYLHQWDQAHAAYQQGHQIAKKCLGEQHPLTQTLGKNCDAALQKSQKFQKERSASSSGAPGNAASEKSPPLLPEISGRDRMKEQQSVQEEPMPMGVASQVHQEASEWVQNEEAWRPPQQSGMPSMQTQPMGQYPPANFSTPLSPRSQQMQAQGLYSGMDSVNMPREPVGMSPGMEPGSQWNYPTFLDTIARDVSKAVPAAAPSSPPPLVVMSRETQRQGSRAAREDKGKSPSDTQDDFLQARGKGGTSEIGRPAGRPPLSYSTARDKRRAARNGALSAGDKAEKEGREEVAKTQAQLMRKRAAEKIQRTWRAHAKYKRENQERMIRENAAATKIQAVWKAYHVRRTKWDQAATAIQKHVRGFLVRLVMRRHNAAVIIQRHAMGLLVRKNLRQFNQAATAIQKRARGKLARRQAKDHEKQLFRAAMAIQRAMRRWKANKIALAKKQERNSAQARVDAAIKIQSWHRGNQGRKKAAIRKRDYLEERERHRAATRLQASVRRGQAQKKVENMRGVRLHAMHKAATTVRKHWLRCVYRRRYLELRREFLLHESSIVTIQRYVRGFIVRLRMWRDAIRSEEELWAAVEIQRVWRGYMGRLRWELAYEAIWSREVAAQRLQRFIRGWLARTRVHRLRKKMARAEFEKARRRFKAAQKIQANVRGWIFRRRTQAWRARVVKVVTTIQRCVRGHRLRSQLWQQVLERRAIQIQGAARGFLIRNRRFHFIAKVIFVQRFWRQYMATVPEAERRRRVEEWRRRRMAATKKKGKAERAEDA